MNQCLSVLLSGSFFTIGSLVFSETQHSVRGPCVVVGDRAGFFEKIFFAPKMGKMGQKQGFLNLLEDLVISFKESSQIFCIFAQIPYLREIWFLRYGPKCYLPIRLQDLNRPYLQNKIMKKPDFSHVVKNSLKQNVD